VKLGDLLQAGSLETRLSVAAVATGRVDRLQFVEVEFDHGLQLFRQP
jgi:hypothetical protein